MLETLAFLWSRNGVDVFFFFLLASKILSLMLCSGLSTLLHTWRRDLAGRLESPVLVAVDPPSWWVLLGGG